MCEETCKKLAGRTIYLVPPVLDINRNFVIENAKIKQSNKLEINLKNVDFDCSGFVGRSFLLSGEDILDIFGSYALSKNEEYIGKMIVDVCLGDIGIVKYVEGTSAQKHFVVEHNSSEVLIPLVDDLINSVNDQSIFMNLPKGILELNEA